MKDRIEKATFDLEKANSLMEMFEESYLDMRVIPSEKERAIHAAYSFYAIRDAINKALEELRELSY